MCMLTVFTNLSRKDIGFSLFPLVWLKSILSDPLLICQEIKVITYSLNPKNKK